MLYHNSCLSLLRTTAKLLVTLGITMCIELDIGTEKVDSDLSILSAHRLNETNNWVHRPHA